MKYSDNSEATLRPSLWVIASEIFWGVVMFILVFPLFNAIYRVAEILCWRYYFNDEKITERTGVFSVQRRELHYARVKSIMVEEPFLFRIVGISNIIIKSSDPYMPVLRLWGIYQGAVLKELIEERVRYWRKKEGIREFDLYNL